MKQLTTAFVIISSLLFSTSIASAFDISQMTDGERATLRAEIRDYLLDNPEVIYEAVDILKERQAKAAENHDRNLVMRNSKAVFNDGYSYVGGNPDGDITLVEFVDYKCGYCRKAHEEVEELLMQDQGIKFIIKEFPILGEASITSAQFVIAVKQLYGSEAYKSAHDILLSYTGETSPTALGRIANALNLDRDAVLGHMNSEKVVEEIRKNRALGQILEITGTPTFILQNEMLRGFVPVDTLLALVAEKRR